MSQLNIVTALRCEADPLARAFGLQRHEGEMGGSYGRARPFRVYSGPRVSLIVSGVGKLASAAASAYLGGLSEGIEPVAWLNVGCGGTADRPLGAMCLAESIRDHETQKVWYPAMLMGPELETAPVTTISYVEREYPGDSIYEMEAAGFFSVAIRFSTLEVVHAVKVISDNGDSDVERVDAALISRLIEKRIPEIQGVTERLLSLADELEAKVCEPERIEAFLQRWRFTFSQRAQLKRALERALAIELESGFLPDEFEGCQSSREVLARMNEKLAEAPVRLV